MARSLVAANIRKAIRETEGLAPDPNPVPFPDIPPLAPGHMRLWRHWRPSLEPGTYGIEAKQVITSTVSGANSTVTTYNYEQTNPVQDPHAPTTTIVQQKFNVIAPQFSIDPGTVNSVYPPPGHADEARVLPHIVFDDPHIPWDRPITVTAPGSNSTDSTRAAPVLRLPPEVMTGLTPAKTTTGSTAARTVATPSAATPAASTSAAAPAASGTAVPDIFLPPRQIPYVMPWFGLVVFTPDELALTAAEETALGIPAPTGTTAPSAPPTASTPTQVGNSPSQVAAPGAYPMTVGQYLTQVKARVQYEALGTSQFAALQSSTDMTNIIFPLRTLAQSVFSPAIQFLFLSHVRQLNTAGLPDKDPTAEAFYAVTISLRTAAAAAAAAAASASASGTPAKPIPQPVIVHLVSLECMDQTTLLTGATDRVGLVSLYSWSYLCLPPNPLNFRDVMLNLGGTMQMLTAGQHSLDTLKASIASQKTAAEKSAAQHLYDRLSRGYTIARWRTAVGQETVAFTRGPLVPLPTPGQPSTTPDSWPDSSNTGKEYQILDRDLGVMDVTYSAAWQLGKLLAISDPVFSGAMLRFRSLVHEAAASATRAVVNAVASKAAIVSNISGAIDSLAGASTDTKRKPARVVLPSTFKPVPPQLNHPDVAPIFHENLTRVIAAQTAAGQAIYSDYQLGGANNSDWAIINRWISDKLFLGGIPSHYLFPDPSLLPSEALRFFYIDNAWLDCFLDGALSVANHLEPVDDKVRRRIKDVYNVYLANNIEPLPIKPPVPVSGFVLRSKLLKVMPDIKVTATVRTAANPNAADTTQQPLVRHTKLDEFTVLCLLDCLPEDIYQVVFAQPPHQQRYVAAADLGSPGPPVVQPTYEIRTLYSQNAPTGEWLPLPTTGTGYPTATQMAAWWDSGTRVVNTIQRVEDTVAALKAGTTNFTDAIDSVVLGLELNDPSYQLIITPPAKSTPSASPLPTRQLWVGQDVADPEDPIQPAKPVIINVPTPPIHPIPESGGGGGGGAAAASSSSAATTAPITVHPASRSQVTVPHRPLPAFSATKLAAQPPPVGNPAKPAPGTPAKATTTTVSPVFSLAIHPDYRNAAPLPFVAANGAKTYSSHDFIPTATVGLLKLIISLQATAASPPATYRLVSLSISIPVATTATTPSSSTAAEPLLQDTTALQADMVSDKRLLPTLSLNAAASSSADSQLTITLTPRSIPGAATADNTIPIAAVADAGLRLWPCSIAAVHKTTQVAVVGQATPTVARGVVVVSLTETYLLPDGSTGTAVTQWDVLKKTGGDVDAGGQPV